MNSRNKPIRARLKPILNIGTLSLLLIAASINGFAQNAYELKKDHFYKTFKKGDIKQDAVLFHSNVKLDEKMFTEFYYQGRNKVFEPLLFEMNQHMDSLGFTSKMLSEIPDKGAPYLFVGSSEAETAPPVTAMMRDEYDKYPPMSMYLEKGSKDWRQKYSELMKQHQGDYALLVWVGLTEYPKANKGTFKKKVVLGTGYEREIRFLSAEDKPVEVLQLTGLLLDNEGKILRAGAEGFLHEDSPFWVQVMEVKTTVDDNAINKLLTEERREDLPGKPLSWKVALTNLLFELTDTPKKHLHTSQ